MTARFCGCEVHHFMVTLVRIIPCMEYLTVEAGDLIWRENERAQLDVPSASPEPRCVRPNIGEDRDRSQIHMCDIPE